MDEQLPTQPNTMIETYLPDVVLLDRHRKLLDKTDMNGNIETNAVIKGLELAYKIKGYFHEEKSAPQINFNFEVSPEDLKLAQDLREQRRHKGKNKSRDGIVSDALH